MESGVGRLCNQVEDSKHKENRRNLLGVAALLLLSSKLSDARQRTRQMIDCNEWLQEQRKEEKKEDPKLNQDWGTEKL